MLTRARPDETIDDPAAIRNKRKEFLGEEVDAFEVHVDDLIEFGLGCLIERLVQGGAGVVHQVIEPFALPTSQCVACVIDKAIERTDIAGVELNDAALLRRLLPRRQDSAPRPRSNGT